jgi:hypothetical protein
MDFNKVDFKELTPLADPTTGKTLIGKFTLDKAKTLGEKGASAVNDIVQLVCNQSTRRPNISKLSVATDVILSNLLIAELLDNYIKYSRTKKDYKPSPADRSNRHLGHVNTLRVVDALVEAGMVKSQRGYRVKNTKTSIDRSSWSKLCPTELFSSFAYEHGIKAKHVHRILPLIQMKRQGRKSNLVPYPIGPTSRKMTTRLKAINIGLNELIQNIYIDYPDGTVIADGSRKHFPDKSYNHLYRVFNHKSFSQGGRFYGHWVQRVPSEHRRLLRIDGSPVVEVDFKGLHIQMLYAKAGEELPAGDVYMLPGVSISTERSVLKHILQYLINGNTCTAKGANASLRKKEKTNNVKIDCTFQEVKKIVAGFKNKHQAIDQYFGTGIGLKLQAEDARMAEVVMLALISKGIAALPVHDSFIVKEEHEDELKSAMQAASLEVCGRGLPVKTDRREVSFVPPRQRPPIDNTNLTTYCGKTKCLTFKGKAIVLNQTRMQ